MKKALKRFCYQHQMASIMFLIGMLNMVADAIAVLMGKDVPLKLAADGIIYGCCVIGAFFLTPHLDSNKNSWKEILMQFGFFLLYLAIVEIIFFVTRFAFGLL